MIAASYTRTGPAADVLAVGPMPDPVPGPGEVLVRVRASGINPADTKRRAGWNGQAMQHPQVIPHTDGAGEVLAVGPGVPASRVGERVWLWNAQGGYGEAGRAHGTAAELIAIAADQAEPLPDGVDFAAGACLGVVAMTAWRAVCWDGPVAGQVVLVQGAGGAVGTAAAQIALAGGARVIGTVTPRSRGTAPAGVELIDRTAGDVPQRFRALTGGRGADRIVEVDFGANIADDAAMLAPGGTIASYSSTSAPVPALPYYALAPLAATIRVVQGFRIPAADRRQGAAALADLLSSGRLILPIGARYPLARIVEAHQRVESGAPGNTVLEP